MAPRRKRRRSKKPPYRRFLVIAAALALIIGGFFIGFRVAQPPPPPDFEALRASAGVAPEASDPRALSVDRNPVAQVPVDTAQQSTADSTDVPDQDGSGAASEDSAPLVLTRQPAPGAVGEPKIAIVIDDLGRSLRDVETLGRLGVPLTYAVLPFETRTAEVVAELRRRQVEIFLHLPMEAKGGANPGPGALLVAMSGPELREATEKALDAVPGAVGVNNHMGSAVASDRRSMTTVLHEIDERGLAFLDSRTSADTLGYSLARQLGMSAGERQVFLDTKKDRAFIRQQFQVLLKEARRRGGAIAIAHPYDETLEILAAEVPKAKELGFDFVPASQLFDS